jgi:outer membrane receptor protein involved in Fe transport
VLSDGIPLKDPFGGWVHWNRIPRAAIDTVEVAAGGASPLYGSDALGGVVNIIRHPVDRPALTVYASFGNQRTPDASLFGSETHGPWAGAIDAEMFHTDGYIPVPVDQRGTVDSYASSEYVTGDLTIEHKLSDHGRIFLRGSSFGEARNNGTLLQNNRTTNRQVNGGGEWHSNSLGSISLAAYAGREVFNQTFSSISPDRDTETLARVQRVPAQERGTDAEWSRGMGRHQTLVAGVEAHEVRGESDEVAIASNTALDAGGRQRNIGVFAEDLIEVTPRWLLMPVARVDHWTNFDAFSSTQPLPAGPVARTPLAERSETFFSPRLGMLYRLAAHLSLTASAYRSFRAPTLNELYRSFRLGNIETSANEQLLAERLTGGEGGGFVTGFHQRLMLRVDFFWAEIMRPIANVTLSTTPALITRQRQNLGRTRSRGVEATADAHINGALTLSGGFQYADATVVNFPGNGALVGRDIPQVPRHVATVQARYFKPRWVTLGVQGRFVGVQYDDDLNTLPLRRFFTMDAMASHPLTRSVDIFLAADNLLNQRYDIARTPVLSAAPPVLVRAGLRLNLGTR